MARSLGDLRLQGGRWEWKQIRLSWPRAMYIDIKVYTRISISRSISTYAHLYVYLQAYAHVSVYVCVYADV